MEYGGVQLSTMLYTRVHYSGVQRRTVEYGGAQGNKVEYTRVHSFCSDEGLTLETSANTLFTDFSISTSTLR